MYFFLVTLYSPVIYVTQKRFSLKVYLKVDERGEVLGDTDGNCVACEGIA